MAIFKRDDLRKQGLNDEQINWIMTEGNRSLSANYTLNSDVQSRVDEAVKAAASQAPKIDVKTTDEYIALQNERDMLRAIGGDDFATVKPKFRETVFGMLKRDDGAPAIAEQLKKIGEEYEEYFTAAAQPSTATPTEQPKNTPQYSQAQGRTGTNPDSEEDKLVAKLREAWK